MSKPPTSSSGHNSALDSATNAEQEAMKKLQKMRGKKLETEHSLSPLNRSSDSNQQAKQDLARRRGRAVYETVRPLSKSLYKTVYPALRGKDSGAALSSLRRRWSEILGEDLAKLCEPVQILKPTTGYVLVLEANSASALKLKHQTDIILERVNAGSGARFKGIRLQQTKTKHISANPKTKLTYRVTPEETAKIEAELDGVESAALKRVLLKLGEAIKSKTETEKAARTLQSSNSLSKRVRSFKSK